MLIPTLSLLFCLLASSIRSYLTDLCGLSLLVPFVTVSFIFSLVPSLKVDSEDGPTFLMRAFALVYLAACNFMSTDFLLCLVTR